MCASNAPNYYLFQNYQQAIKTRMAFTQFFSKNQTNYIWENLRARFYFHWYKFLGQNVYIYIKLDCNLLATTWQPLISRTETSKIRFPCFFFLLFFILQTFTNKIEGLVTHFCSSMFGRLIIWHEFIYSSYYSHLFIFIMFFFSVFFLLLNTFQIHCNTTRLVGDWNYIFSYQILKAKKLFYILLLQFTLEKKTWEKSKESFLSKKENLFLFNFFFFIFIYIFYL